MPLRILIADDSEPLRRALKHALAADAAWSVCGEAADGPQAISQALELRPDVILLDLSLPHGSGTSLTAQLRDAVPSAEIVLISAQDPAILKHIAGSASVRHYVPKSSLGTDLIPTLQSILREKETGAEA